MQTARQLLGPQGPIARRLGSERFEEREAQVLMAEAVEAALSSGRHAMIEAGTGVGKTFAYLVPLLRWAHQHDKRVAVSTSTIALQEQIVDKDLPLLAEVLPVPVTYALVKGRGNYLCKRRMFEAHAQAGALFDDEADRADLARVVAWAATTETGTKQELDPQPRPDVWDAVRAESGNCLHKRCPHYRDCGYQASRVEMREARLLVLNHHLLMADLAMQRAEASFLPPLDAIVVDEAHDLEGIAAEHLGAQVTALGTLRMLGRLWSPARRKGLLARGYPEPVRQQVQALRQGVRVFFEAAAEDAQESSDAAGGSRTMALPPGQQLQNPLSVPLRDLASSLEAHEDAATSEDHLREVTARARGLVAFADHLDELLAPTSDADVRWVELGARGRVSLHRAPIDVGAPLREVLWDTHDSVLLASATLAVGRPPSFAFMQGRLGLGDVDAHAVGSPFDFRAQAVLRLFPGLPDPGRAGAAFEAALPAAILRTLEDCEGGALVLFTSYASLRRAAHALRDPLVERGFELLVQGEGRTRSVLLERMRQGGAVLLGVSSFWQGVDIPGDALTHVVITRLPFEVPTHPLQTARLRKVEEAGGSAFGDLSLPQAVLRLKQGFGRLIRRRTDRGVVAILDPRIETRRYGRTLLDSLPPCRVEHVAL